MNHKEGDDRDDGGELQTGFKRTLELWKIAHNEPYGDRDTSCKRKHHDSQARVFAVNGNLICVDDEYRKSFIPSAASYVTCQDKVGKDMCSECKNNRMKTARWKRGGQVKGGACGALYARGRRILGRLW